MISSTRHMIREAALWLLVFTATLAALVYLDNRLDLFAGGMGSGKPSTLSPSLQQPSSGPAGDPADNEEEQAASQQDDGQGRVVIEASRQGHFEVSAYINGDEISLLADTGATLVVLTWEDAETIGITGNLHFTGRAQTANGVAKVAPVIIDRIEIGDISLNHVRAVVAEEGALEKSLLGMSFIGRLSSFKMSGRELILEQ